MSVFIASIILLVIGSAYAVLLKRKLAETLFLAVAMITAVLYCFGLLNFEGCLLFGIYTVIALSFVSVLVLIYAWRKRKNDFLSAELVKGCLIFTGFLAFALFVNYGRTFQHWDEFSHWGTIVKHFYIVDAFGTVRHPNYYLIFPSYFPGTSLFQYYFSRFSGQFIEYYSYIAMNVMYSSLIMPFTKDILKKGKGVKQLVILAIFFALPVAFSQSFYSTLYVDTILGLFFGFALLYYFKLKYEKSFYGILMVSATIFLMTLTKDMGLLFSLIVSGVIAVDIVFFRRTQVIDNRKKGVGSLYRVREILLLFLPLICALFIRLSWLNILDRSGIKSKWYIPTANDIYRFFTGQLELYQKDTRHNFFFAMFQRETPFFNVSIVSFAIIFVVIILAVAFIYREKYAFLRMVTSALLLTAGLAGYQLVLALAYAFSFNTREGPQLASYERYTSTYMIGMALFIFLFYVTEPDERNRLSLSKLKELSVSDEMIKYKNIFIYGKMSIRALTASLLFIAMIGAAGAGIYETLGSRIIQADSFQPRSTAIAAEKWKPYLEKEFPYFIEQGSYGGYRFLLMRYELMPYATLANRGVDYSISLEPYYTEAGDPWTFIITPEEWGKYVLNNEFKLVWVYETDEVLETVYGQFFPYGVQEDMLYHVQEDEGRLALVPVEK